MIREENVVYDLEEYVQIFREVLGLEYESDIFGAVCEDIEEWDSYTHMELIAAIEEKFQIRFEGEDVLKFVSFDDGLVILREKGAVFEGNNP